MFSKLRARAGDESGFTLIELLVVILIIGILAAIAIPSFLNQKDKANDAAAKSDAKTAQTAMETYYTDNQTYDASGSALTDIESALTNANNLVFSGTTNTFAIATQSKGAGGVWYGITRSSTGAVARVCGTSASTVTSSGGAFSGLTTPPAKATGGCKATGTW